MNGEEDKAGERQLNFKDISQIITIMAAFVGMGLGIYNFWIERSKKKVKILVKPKAVIQRFRNSETGAPGVLTSENEFIKEPIDQHFAIEAVNLSSFPVTIDNVGFELDMEDKRKMIVQPVLMDEGKWPRRLDQRESVMVYGSLPNILGNPDTCRIRNAFVETSCGTICRGTSGALKGLVLFASQLRQKGTK